MRLIAKTISIEIPEGWHGYRVCDARHCRFGPKGLRTRRPLDQTFCPRCKRPLVVDFERVKICAVHDVPLRRITTRSGGRFYSHRVWGGWCHGGKKK